MQTFRENVLQIVRQIPLGKTLSYKEVAMQAGNPKASRAVGAILKTNYDPQIPCHRVVRSDGKFGGYNRGSSNKEKLLKLESGFEAFKRADLATAALFLDEILELESALLNFSNDRTELLLKAAKHLKASLDGRNI